MNGNLFQKGIAKRLLSLALVVAMVLSFAPVGAFRASASGNAYTFTSTYNSATGITKLMTKANDEAAESAKGAEVGDTLEVRKANKDAKIDIFVYGHADYPEGNKISMSGTLPYTYMIPTGYILSEISYADSPSNGAPATFNITLAPAADYTLTFSADGEWTGDLEEVKSAKGGDVIKVVNDGFMGGWLSCYIPSEGNTEVYNEMDFTLAGEFTIPDGYEVKSVTTKTQGPSKVLDIQLQRATIHVSSVSVEPATAKMILGGDTLTLTATVSPDNAANKSVTWESGNTAVATVANGVVTAVAVGEATITATSVDGSLTGSCVVTVYIECTCTAHEGANHFYSLGSAPGDQVVGIYYYNDSVYRGSVEVDSFSHGYDEGWYYYDTNILKWLPCTGHTPAPKGEKIGNSNTYWDLTEGVLTISGEGAMPDFAYITDQPWKDVRESITSIVVESGVTAVGKSAFNYCKKATSVSLPDSLTSLGEYAFSTCSELTTVAVPANVTTIGKGAFDFCTKLTSVNIPDGVTVINEGVFNHCESLTSITIPAGVTAINKNAFAYCYYLKDVVIPSGVTTIGNSAFYYTHYYGANSSITIPASVTSIGANAFESCSKLTSVTVERITPPTAGSNLFKGITRLATITVPKSAVDAYKAANGWQTYADKIVGAAKYTEAEVMALADDAEVMDFVDAGNTTFAALLANMGYVDGSFSGFFDELGAEMVFADTNAPTYVWKDESGMSISILFDTNNKIQSLTYTLTGEEYPYTPVPELTVGEYNVVVPTGVSALTPDQLAIVPTKVKASLTALETGWYVVNKDVAFTKKLDVKGDVNLILADGCTMTATQLKYASACESLTIWGQSAGTGTLSVTNNSNSTIHVETVTINGGTVKADAGDTGIRGLNVTVNAGIVNAKGDIGLHGSESLVINGGIVTAEGETCALYYDNQAAKLTINSALTVMAGGDARSATVTSYNGQEYVNIAKGQKLGTSDTYWDLSDGVLTISGTGAMPDFESRENAPWFESYKNITSVVIESGVTAIGNNAFSPIGECGIVSVSIGNTVTSIGDAAFYSCYGIQSVTLPDSVTTIGKSAFNNISTLTSVTIPANVTSIGAYAFANCAYTKVTVKATTPPTLGEDAFTDLGETYVLTKITVPSGTAAAYKAANGWKDYADVITDISHEHSFTYALAEGAADTIVATCGEADCDLDNNQVSVTLTVGDAADSTTPVTFTKVDGTGTLSSEGMGEPSDFTYDGVAYKVYNAFVPATADSSWNDAMGFVAKLNEAKFEGHSDWQLLSSKEMAKAWKTQFYSTVNYGDINFLWTSVTNDTNAFFFYPGLFGGTMMETSKASTSSNNGFFVLRTAGANVDYTGSAVEAAMDTTDWVAAGLTAPTVSYEAKTGSSLTDSKAVNVGSYTAKITVDTATASVDFTITKVASAVSTAPTAVANLTYTGAAQNLITTGSVAGGTLQYSLDGTNYSTTVPQGTDAGDYTVYYKVVGDANHDDVAAASVSVTMAKANASVSAAPEGVANLTYTGEAQTLITAGTASGGTLKYSLDNETYTTTLPQATDADSYTVYYKVEGDANHNDSAAANFSVTIAQAAASVGTAPTAKVGLVYSGAAQELVNAGSNVVGGTLQYSLDGTNYAEAIPTATAVNNYNVYYKVVGDTNHQDTTPLYVTVAIGENTAVNSVISLIDAIGTVEYTSESKQKIDAARAAYNALSAANQTLVTNYTTLTTAEADYKALDAVSCKFEETVKLSEGTYKVYLNAKLAGTYTFESVSGGYAIKDKEGYLTVENGKLTHTQDPAAWMYKNGGLAMTNTHSTKILGIFKASTKVTYYLASATSVMPYVVRCELRKDATDSHNYGPWLNNKNGTHTKQCTLCTGIETENCKYDEVTHLCVCGAYDPAFKSVNVSVNVKKSTTGRLLKVTTYNYTISTEAVGCKVAAVQYHVTDNLWLTGKNFTWVSKVKKLDIRVIDTDGGMHYFAYDGETGTVTPVTK